MYSVWLAVGLRPNTVVASYNAPRAALAGFGERSLRRGGEEGKENREGGRRNTHFCKQVRAH